MMAMRIGLLFALSVMIALLLMSVARFDVAIGSKTIVVPTDFLTIQEAINNAVEGDTVFVRRGTYVENVIVDRTVSLVGENKTVTFIGSGGASVTLTVSANNVSISGFTIESGSLTDAEAGIVLHAVRNANLTDNVIVSSYSGVSLMNSSMNNIEGNGIFGCNISLYLDYSSGNTLRKNTFANSSAAGVYLHNSPSNAVLENNVVVVGGNGYGLKVESSENSVVEGNLVEQSAGGGINVYSSSNCNVTRNTVVRSGSGILVQGSANTSLISNAMANNTGDGIYFSYSENCSALGNNVNGNVGYGIIFRSADQGTAHGNYVENNTQPGIYLSTGVEDQIDFNVIKYNGAGIRTQACPNTKVNTNQIVGNTNQGVILVDSWNSTILTNTILDNGLEGLSLQNSGNSTTGENIVCGNGNYGIWLQDSPNVSVLGSNVSFNAWDGIYLRQSNYSRIVDSIINANGEAGSRLYYCDLVTFAQDNITGNKDGLRAFLANNNTVSENTIMGNLDNGVNIFNSTGNSIFHNRFINNTVQALSSESTGFWDSGYPSGGNYWSDYVGVDFYWEPSQNQSGSDGLGDTPYVIDSENRDRYPLMTPSRFHDLRLERFALPSNEVYAGWVLRIDATVKNNGGYVESFNITAYYDDAVVAACFIGNLTVGKNYTASLTWNTSSLQYCQVNDVKAEIVSTEISGTSMYGFGVVKVKMVGDVNGDGKVNILDIAALATGFGGKIGDTGYKLNYDMNLDYVINIVDISLSARNYSKTCP